MKRLRHVLTIGRESLSPAGDSLQGSQKYTHELRHTLTGGDHSFGHYKNGKVEEIQIQASGIKAWSLENSELEHG